YVTLSETRNQLTMVISTITSDFIGSETMSPTYGILTIRRFAEETIKSLKARFPDCRLYSSMCILEPREMPSNRNDLDSYGETEILILANFYGKDKKNSLNKSINSPIHKDKLIREWRMAKNILYDYKSFNFIEAWKRIWTNNPNFHQQFSNLSSLVQLALIVPISNGNVEQVFSHQNLIKTKLRNLLSIETLNYHLQISLNGCENYSSFDYNEAYNYWNN
ncbi:2996_t:CDS:2, partial [Entrophospora sp. SA101]